MTIKDKSFRFNLDEQEYKLLEDEAQKRGISMAGVLRQYIRSLAMAAPMAKPNTPSTVAKIDAIAQYEGKSRADILEELIDKEFRAFVITADESKLEAAGLIE